MLQTRILDCESADELQEKLDTKLEKLYTCGIEVKDIKYFLLPETNYNCPSYSAMIVIED